MRSKAEMNIRFKVKVSFSDKWKQAITSLAQTLNRVKPFRNKNPDGLPLLSETHVLAFDEDLYGIRNACFNDLSKKRRRSNPRHNNKNNNSIMDTNSNCTPKTTDQTVCKDDNLEQVRVKYEETTQDAVFPVHENDILEVRSNASGTTQSMCENTTLKIKRCEKILDDWKEGSEDWKDDSPDTFNDALLKEGILEFSDIASGRPVLSIGYGFYNEELVAAASRPTPEDQIRIQLSLAGLPPEQREQYLRVFSRQHPQEASVNGVPESIWLAWLEPSLPFLSNLSRIKRRRSNLSRKNTEVPKMDSCNFCHGDHQFHQFLPYRFWGNVQQFANLPRRRYIGPTELQTAESGYVRHAMADRRQRPRFRYRPYPQVAPLRAQA